VKISIITVTWNCVTTIQKCLDSVGTQIHPEVEHIVIDGVSTDGTLEALKQHRQQLTKLVSEPDQGIYHALNKGLSRATGDVVGVMHSDDFFADAAVLSDVASAFEDSSIDAVYGDLEYVAKNDPHRVIRHWRSGEFSPARLAWGWMPPHPALFLRRQVVEQWGGYETRFRIAADYDAVLRYFGRGGIRPAYIPRVLVKMRVGGASNRSLRNIIRKSTEDYLALRRNRVGGFVALAWKNFSKIPQFFTK